MRKPVFGVSGTNQASQPLETVRGLRFRIKEVEGLYYPCSENKGADQLPGYREAGLRLCFRICKQPVFQRCGSFLNMICSGSTVEQKVVHISWHHHGLQREAAMLKIVCFI